MIPLALSLLTSRIAGPIATVLCVILLGLSMSQCSGRVKAEKALAQSQRTLATTGAALATCRGNVARQEAALARQNAAVAVLGQESAARVAQSVRAASQARSQADGWRRRADLLLAEPVLAGNECVAADALILREAAR